MRPFSFRVQAELQAELQASKAKLNNLCSLLETKRFADPELELQLSLRPVATTLEQPASPKATKRGAAPFPASPESVLDPPGTPVN